MYMYTCVCDMVCWNKMTPCVCCKTSLICILTGISEPVLINNISR